MAPRIGFGILISIRHGWKRGGGGTIERGRGPYEILHTIQSRGLRYSKTLSSSCEPFFCLCVLFLRPIEIFSHTFRPMLYTQGRSSGGS